MNTNQQVGILACAVFLLAVALPAQAQTPQNQYSVRKHERLIQTGTSTLNPDPTRAWYFATAVRMPSPADLSSSPTVTAPGGGTGTNPVILPYSPGDGSYLNEFDFSTRAALDAAYPDGAYLMHLVSLTFGTKNVNLVLNPAVYTFPIDIPTLSNTSWSGGVLVLDATVANTLSWNAFTQMAGNDATQFSLKGTAVNINISGAITSNFINAGTLVPGQTYNGSIEFSHVTTYDTTSVPGLIGVGVYIVRTSFAIRTLPTLPAMAVARVPGQPGAVDLVFSPLVPGYGYTVETSPDLTPSSWVLLTGATQTDAGQTRTVRDPNATGLKKFYRVVIAPF